MTENVVLLGDIGATNARLALNHNGKIGQVQSFDVSKHRSFIEVIDLFLNSAGGLRPRDALFAIAAPVNGARLTLTNANWVIDTQELEATLHLRCTLINDFEAAAFSLPLLGQPDLEQLGSGSEIPLEPKVIFGPGSGLGVACHIPTDGQPVVIASEGGHSTISGTCGREDEVIRQLRERFDHVSFERAVSGPGLENIYQAILTIDGAHQDSLSAAMITEAALAGTNKAAIEALNLFCGFMGTFAGNIALVYGARGGVFIAGGISPRIISFLKQSQFRSHFEAKGRFRSYLANIPSYVVVHPAVTFLGLAYWLQTRSKSLD